jgi:hypothetical protein
MKKLLWGLDLILPNLDRYTRSEWLAGHIAHPQDLLGLLAMTLAYGTALLSASMIDFTRRNL